MSNEERGSEEGDSANYMLDMSPDIEQGIKDFRFVLSAHMRIMDGIIHSLTSNPSNIPRLKRDRAVDPDVASVLSLLCQAAGSSSNSLLTLTQHPGMQSRDCYTITRSIVEVAVNVCYIIAGGAEVAQKALRHAKQKTYRDFERESKVGGQVIRLVFSGKPAKDHVPNLIDQITEFTSSTGREKGWTELSIDDRIASAATILGEDVLSPLHWSRFIVYRHSSEIIHGTVFGQIYFWKIGLEDKASRKLGDLFGEHQISLLLAANLALRAIGEGFHKAFGFEWAKRSNELLIEKMRRTPYLKPGQGADVDETCIPPTSEEKS